MDMLSLIMKKSRFFTFFKPRSIPITKTPVLFPCGMSRSGTTLLTTILDSHPAISLGYELIPPPGLQMQPLLAGLTETEASEDDLKAALETLRKSSATDRNTEQFLNHCVRAGINRNELQLLLNELLKSGFREIRTLRDRLYLAYRVSELKRFREQSGIAGFKLNIPSVSAALSFFPKGIFIFILRDPRDVVASHIKRNFNRSVRDICGAWMNYITCFEKLYAANPGKALIFKYENLVTKPADSISTLFEVIPLEPQTENLLNFYRSQASVHQGGHPNIKELQSDFFTTSVGRWENDLSKETTAIIERLCAVKMNAYGYTPSLIKNTQSKVETSRIGRKVRKENTVRIKARKFLDTAEYEKILSPYLDGFESLRLSDYVREKDIGNRNILLIRHDVDHDHHTAVKIARWEASKGLKATYCLLHTAWYYGRLQDEKIIHTDELIECAQTIQDLGHEINLHNNFVSVALKEGIDPVKLLGEELDFFRSIGIVISGTSTHGDKLCRELNFRNWELFTECCDDRFGGPRTVEYGNNRVKLGEVSMKDFGLEYEAYDIARDSYYTDSGGKPRMRKNLPGRKSFGRLDPGEGTVAGILTHPIYWHF